MKDKKIRILSIDGGGIRGIIPGQILTHIEKLLGYRIGEHFDMIAGTSTGGILSCALLFPNNQNPPKPKYSAQEVVDLYFKWGGDIFEIPFFHRIRSGAGLLDEKYPADGLEEALETYFENKKLSELLKPTVITAYDIYNRKTEFFTQHDAVSNPSKDFLVKDVARATSAAPTYFECARIKSFGNTRPYYPLVDGGVFANNPSLCSYAEARTLFKKPGDDKKNATAIDLAILSIGTGYSKKQYHYKEAKDWGMAEWIKPLIDILMSGVSETIHYQLDQIFKSVNALKNQYLRIDGEMTNDVDPDMDDASEGNMGALKKLGDNIFNRYKSDIQQFLTY